MIKENLTACTGCGNCEQICPFKSIKMEERTNGFLYPIVDTDKCTECGKCESVCPIDGKCEKMIQSEDYFGYSLDKQLRRESSSGGMFGMFARIFLDEKGIVCGAAFADDFSVHHVCIDSVDDMPKLQGSKYVQSKLGNVFCEIQEYLDVDRKVLFVGTPCQVTALKHYLKRDYDSLFTIDFICHGVPSNALWLKYLDKKKEEYTDSIKKISFRNKDFGWNLFSIKIEFSHGEKYQRLFFDDEYGRGFCDNVFLRASCYECQFKDSNSYADVSIGDAWGITNMYPELDDNKGTSSIMVRTQKGHELISQFKSDDIILKPVSCNETRKYNSAATVSNTKSDLYELFADEFEQEGSWDDLYGIVSKGFPEIDSKYKRYKNVIIWGCGRVPMFYIHIIRYYYKILGFCDSNQEKWNKEICPGLYCYPFDIFEKTEDLLVIICIKNQEAVKDIKEKLREKDFFDVISATELFEE